MHVNSVESGDYQHLTNTGNTPNRLTVKVVSATFTACLGAIAFGFVMGYPSPVEKHLESKLNWSSQQLSWFNAIAAIGAIFGALVGLRTIDKFGRKCNIMMSSFPMVAGWIIIISVKRIELFYLGRFLTGIGVGVVSLSVPVYIAEIAPAKYRGALGCTNQLGVTFGILLAYCFGASLNWHWLAVTAAVPPSAMVLLMTQFPETPRWLIKNKRFRDAYDSLMYLRNASEYKCRQEHEDIRHSLESSDVMSLVELKKPLIYRPLIVVILIMLFQQFSGINAVLSYASIILGDAGIKNSNLAEITVALIQFVATAISCLIADKLGRRLLLLFPTALMCISMVALGLSEYYADHFPKVVTVISLCCFVIGFSLGLGPIPWVLMSEIFPSKARGVAGGIVTVVNWLSVFTVIKSFVDMKEKFHSYGCYWFYAAVCFLCVVYVFIFLPETKGKSLEDVEELFVQRQDLSGSNDFSVNSRESLYGKAY